MSIRTKRVLAAAIAATTAAVSFAAGSGANDARAIDQARIPLTQAVAAAEQHAGGKAARAEFEKTKAGRWVFDIEVVKGADTFDVRVDALAGTVISSARDSADHDDDHDQDD